MKKGISLGLSLSFVTCLGLLSCNDEISPIGGSIFDLEVAIRVDSVEYNLKAPEIGFAESVPAPSFATRSEFTLLGSLEAKEYGTLKCSYVSRLLPAEYLTVPDSITWEDVDSVKMILSIPSSKITGNTNVPQQLKVFTLTTPLPNDITSDFNPDGYYNPTPLGIKNYTLSGIKPSESNYSETTSLRIGVNLPVQIGKDAFKAYRDNPSLFVWPAEFAKAWPGIYVSPSFGNGCLAAIESSRIYAYFPKSVFTNELQSDGTYKQYYKIKPDSVCLFSTAPEVLASVNVNYKPSDNIKNMITSGRSVITTPGGYVAQLLFPALHILEDYWTSEYNLGVINNLTFGIPAKEVENTLGIGIPSSLVMVKTSELESFFADGKVPDNKMSFLGSYSTVEKKYYFTGLRQYIVDLRAKGKDNIKPEDMIFTLVPVSVFTDNINTSAGTTESVVTKVVPYLAGPSMVELDMTKTQIVFTYSNQIVE